MSRNRQLTGAAILASIVIILGSLRMTPHVSGAYHDDGIYVATAKALAEGHGYRLINLPGAPPQTKYPFLYPAVLAAIWKVWPEYPANLIALQGMSLLFAAAAVALGYLYLLRQRFAGSMECFAACLLCATSPTFLYFATQALSEMLFAVLLIGSLWSLEPPSSGRSVGTFKRTLTGIAAGLPFLCRSLGACVPPVVIYELRRRSLPLIATILSATATVAPWLIWLALRRPSSTGGVLDYYVATNYLSWWFSEPSVWIPLLNALRIGYGAVTLPFEGLLEIGGAFVWPVLLVGALLFWSEVFQNIRVPIVILFASYAAIILFWPWPPERFLVPWLPLLTIFLVRSAKHLSDLEPTRMLRLLGPAMLVVAVTANVIFQVRLASLVRGTGYPYEDIPKEPVFWRQYEATFGWVRQNTPADAIIASGLDSMVFLHTGRRGYRPFVHHRPLALFYGSGSPPLGTPEEFAEMLGSGEADYLVELPMPGFAEDVPLADLIRQTRARRPDCMRVVYTLDTDRRFRISELNKLGCATGGNSR